MKPNLYIQTAFLGDLLLAIPSLKLLKQSGHPTVLLCRKGLGAIFEKLQLVDEVIEVDKTSSLSRYDLAQALKSMRFENVICPHESLTSMRLCFSAKAVNKVGFYKWWNFWALNQRVKKEIQCPEAIRQMQLVKVFDKQVGQQIDAYISHFTQQANQLHTWPEKNQPAYVPEFASMGMGKFFDQVLSGESDDADLANDRAIVEQLLESADCQNSPYYLLAPGSVWGTKMWTGYVPLAKRLIEHGKVIFIGAPSEKSLCQEMASEVAGAVNLAGTSLMQTLLLMRKSTQLFTNDCGAMHLASLADIPCVSVFGPTVLKFGYRPWQNRAIVLENKTLSCRPCGSHGPKTCPIGTHECMTSVSAASIPIL